MNFLLFFKGKTVRRQQVCDQKDHCSGNVGHRFVDGQRKPIEIHSSSG